MFLMNEDELSEIYNNIRVANIKKKYKSNVKIKSVYFDSIYKLRSFYSKRYNDERTNGLYAFCDSDTIYAVKKEKYRGYFNYDNLIVHECTHAVLFSKNPKCSSQYMELLCIIESNQIEEMKKYYKIKSRYDLWIDIERKINIIQNDITLKGYNYIIKCLKKKDFNIN